MTNWQVIGFKTKFIEIYNYVVRSVKRGSAYPVPVSFIKDKDEDGNIHIRLPLPPFEWIVDEMFRRLDKNSKNLLTWFLSFDITPLIQYEEMFVEAESERICYNFGEGFGEYCDNFIVAIGEIAEKLKEWHIDNEELLHCTIARKDKNHEVTLPTNNFQANQEHQEGNEVVGGDEANQEEVNQEEAKEFARTFIGTGEESVEIATEILEHIRPLDNAPIAHYIYDCKYRKKFINEGINDKTIWQWLKGHSYKVASIQAFNQVMNREAAR